MLEQEKTKKKPLLYIQDRWDRELVPVLSQATLQQEEQLEALWERTLRWLKEERGLEGDSLRKPITQLRGLIKNLPLTPENTWSDPRSNKPEHIAYHIFNLPELVWTQMNVDEKMSLQERLENQQFLDRPDAIVNQALILIQSDDWAELVVGLALCTGRRLGEVMKTGVFVEKSPYSVWFTGQTKGHGREDVAFEIPTLVRAFLVVEARQRLRRLMDCTGIEVEQVSQRYNQAVNKVVVHSFSDLIPVRVTRDRLSVHTLRAVYARIAVYWYAPPEVADITFMAQIQGHRYILEPEVEQGDTPETLQQKQLSYAAGAHYFDYKIGRKTVEGGYQIVGDQGIKLGHPGVTRLDAFPVPMPSEEQEEPSGKRKGKKAKKESTSDWAPLTIRRHSRDWFRDVSGSGRGSTARQSEKDDAFVRKLLTQHVVGGQAEPAEGAVPVLSLDLLDETLPEKTRDLFRQAMAIAGSTDLLSFLLAVAEPEAQRLVKAADKHGARRFEQVPTDKLDARDPDASNERFRRAVYTVMEYNRGHALAERWFLSDLAIQNLVGGRKDSIKAYKVAHEEEIAVHHREFGVEPGFNRKPGSPRIQDVIHVPNEPSAFPWGTPPVVSQS